MMDMPYRTVVGVLFLFLRIGIFRNISVCIILVAADL